MAAAVVADGGAEGFVANGGEVGEQRFERLLGELGRGGEAGVEIMAVGGVVLAVVDFHGPGVEVRLQGVEGIGQGGQLVGRDGLSAGGVGKQGGGGGKGAEFHEMTAVEGG